MLIALNKPYRMLSQFNANPDEQAQRLLGALPRLLPAGFFPLGRLDYHSEGLLLFSRDRSLERSLLGPSSGHSRRYLVQVAGPPSEASLAVLREGTLVIRPGGRPHHCLPAQVKRLVPPPGLWSRCPPVDKTQCAQSTWLDLTLREGKNRQVRRMTAAVGHPTLRLVRVTISRLELSELQLPSGEWKYLDSAQQTQLF